MVSFIIYSGGRWEVVNGRMEYVVDSSCKRRGFEIDANIPYLSFLNVVSDVCEIPNITRLSYKMSAFDDAIDIFNDRDVSFLFKVALQNPYEVLKLYVVDEPGVGSSSNAHLNEIPSNDSKVPDLNVSLENFDHYTPYGCFGNFNDEKAENEEFDGKPSPELFSELTKTSSVFSEGSVFRNKDELKLQLGNFCLSERFSYKVDRSSKTRYEISCVVDDCDWQFRSRSVQSSGTFYVTFFNNNHTCSKTQTHPHLRQANPQVIGNILKHQLRDARRVYRGNEIVQDFRDRFKVDISYTQAWRGKCHALELLQGNSKQSFSELPFYCYNLRNANPGTVTEIRTDEDNRFEMLFIAIGATVSKIFLPIFIPT